VRGKQTGSAGWHEREVSRQVGRQACEGIRQVRRQAVVRRKQKGRQACEESRQVGRKAGVRGKQTGSAGWHEREIGRQGGRLSLEGSRQVVQAGMRGK
jgi:hypothetical protein